MAALQQYDWILAIVSIAFIGSSFGNGANDVANSYATSVAARTLTMPQVGFLSMCTEFVGAVALGARVTGTIKNNIMDITRFEGTPATLMLAMGCAEVASATWLLVATRLGFPVSTTQTIVGALVGSGLASRAAISWGWDDGSVSQIAASWGIAPLISAAISAILYATLKFAILERENSFEKAMRAIPIYLAFTGGVLALFITIEAPVVDIDELGPGRATGIVLGVFFACLAVAYIFFVPYFHRRLVQKDARVRPWHIPLGPLLYRESTNLYWPGDASGELVTDYYANAYRDNPQDTNSSNTDVKPPSDTQEKSTANSPAIEARDGHAAEDTGITYKPIEVKPEPEERWLAPYKEYPLWSPSRLKGMAKYVLFQGVARDCVSHSGAHIASVHARAKRYDNRVEHLWTYAQVASAMMMSIAHGSNDVANAVGPWVATYNVFQSGVVSEDSDTPIWILIIAGFLLGAGFWFYGYHIIRAMGNKITQMSPTRGFSMELGAAITVLIASRLGLPVSTTQCLTGATLGVALMNLDLGAVNWRQLAYIFMGWVLTLPIAGLLSGLMMVMALNAPQF